MKTPVLLVPGIGNSGPAHWQTRWEAKHPNTHRVLQADWDHPNCNKWAEQLEHAVHAAEVPPVLVAHSLGCLVVARWGEMSRLPIRAALLVAVPDPAGPAFPKEATGFLDTQYQLGNRRTVMVSSSNDPFSTRAYTKQRALEWNAEHIELGACGHINADSGLGDWDKGWTFVENILDT